MTEVEEIPKHWVTVYPAYINSKRTLEEGRRVAKAKGVENPTTQEIFDVLKSSGLPCRAERKMYPRDGARDWTYNGRVRVELKTAEGKLVDPAFPTRRAILAYAVDMIPKLKSRLQKSAQIQDAASNQKPPKKGKKNR